jgi:hypothetical protein
MTGLPGRLRNKARAGLFHPKIGRALSFVTHTRTEVREFRFFVLGKLIWVFILSAGLVLLILNCLPAVGGEAREVRTNLSVFSNRRTAANVQETSSCC